MKMDATPNTLHRNETLGPIHKRSQMLDLMIRRRPEYMVRDWISCLSVSPAHLNEIQNAKLTFCPINHEDKV